MKLFGEFCFIFVCLLVLSVSFCPVLLCFVMFLFLLLFLIPHVGVAFFPFIFNEFHTHRRKGHD